MSTPIPAGNISTINIRSFQLSFEDAIPYITYQYFSFIAVIVAVVTIVLSFFRKAKHMEHATAQILFNLFLLTNLIKSIISSALTTNVINFEDDLFDISRGHYNMAIMIACVYLKLILFFFIIDSILKAHFGQNYGKGFWYSIMCCVISLAALALSYYMGSLIFVIRVTGNAFILYFKLVITSVQFLSTFGSIFLFYFVKHLRKQSITSSSLSIRHECGKNVLLLKGQIPMVTIDSTIGTFAVVLSLLGTYVFAFPTNLSFSLYFAFFEATSILICVSLIWNWHKTDRIKVFNFLRKSSQVAVIQTMTTKVPVAQTHDAYFKTLQKAWNKHFGLPPHLHLEMQGIPASTHEQSLPRPSEPQYFSHSQGLSVGCRSNAFFCDGES